MKYFIKYSLVLITLIIFTFISGCACNKNFKEGFIKGALIGGAAGGAGGYALTDDRNDDDENIAIGVGIGAIIGGIIGGFTNICEEPEVIEAKVADVDSDGDGVVDRLDECPDTPRGVKVDYKGCPLDTDGDGVTDDKDRCPATPRGVRIDAYGCPLDSDRDGVTDDKDQCPDTPRGVRVGANGCPPDSDRDGVTDDKDQCPDTPRGVRVGANGCPLDSDRDGVTDDKDQCPGTPRGAKVNEAGCWTLQDTIFDFDSAKINPDYYPLLDNVVDVLKQQPDLKVEIQGHTCNIGPANYNQILSERRAKSVMKYLINKGIDETRLSASGYGESKPIASNDTKEGRSLNRRAQIEPVK